MAKKKIKTLTDEQRARFGEWVEKWKAIGLSCEPADWGRAERGIRAHYEAANLPPPKRFVRVSSPLTCALAGPMAAVFVENVGAVDVAVDVAVNGAVNGAVSDAVSDAVDRAVYVAVSREVSREVDGAVSRAVGAVDGAVDVAVSDAVSREVGAAVFGEVLPSVDGVVGEAIPRAVYGTVNRAVYDSVRKIVTPSILREAAKNSWYRHNGGAWGCYYPAYATFFRDVMGCDIPIGPREDTDSSCGWWWPHKEFCIVSDRPAAIRRDERGRLHSANGPAIEWRDGWSLSFWHGVNVPHEWITRPETIDPALALNHENAEKRRCLAEILGWGRILNLLEPKVIDADPDPEVGQLLEVVLDGTPERFLKVRCGTGREFVLPVPPEMTRALEANAWTYGLDSRDFLLEART